MSRDLQTTPQSEGFLCFLADPKSCHSKNDLEYRRPTGIQRVVFIRSGASLLMELVLGLFGARRTAPVFASSRLGFHTTTQQPFYPRGEVMR